MTDWATAGRISVNGIITPIADAAIPAMDHGFLFGDSVYEVVRTLHGRPVAMGPHLDRMRRSAAMIYMEIPWPDDHIRARIREAVDATGLDEVYVRIVVTRGAGPMTLLPDDCSGPSLVVYVLPLRLPSRDDLENGITVAVPERLRNDERALPPGAKTGNYLNNELALVEARRAGAADAILVNAEGHVTEATTANVFWVAGGTVFTPSLDSGILSGITRKLLLPAIGAAGLDVREGRYPLSALQEADEAFLTGTIRGVCPVVRIGDDAVGAGVPGPVTAKVKAIHDRLLEENSSDW